MPVSPTVTWQRPSDAELASATRTLQHALDDEQRAVRALVEFYDPSGNYAARSFLDVAPNDPFDIVPADLLAITLLDVTAEPRAVRLMLDAGETRDVIVGVLRDIPRDADLVDADATVLEAASALHIHVKAALGKNPWVIASKLCARKRPALFPVRDSVIVAQLGLQNRDHRIDWLVFRHLLSDDALRTRVRDLSDRAGAELDIPLHDVPELRLIDTLLWMIRPAHRS